MSKMFVPKWSIMIPSFNCADYLKQTLESVLMQDMGTDQMHIEVVDDCSFKDNPKEVVQQIGKGRVDFFKQPSNVGATRNFNTCIERAKGEFVHILHGDDWVHNGFYREIEALINTCKDATFYATRNYFVDEKGLILGESELLPKLAHGSHDNSDFFYKCPTQFAGIVIRKKFYDEGARFDTDLVHTTDIDMWARAIYYGKGIVSEKVLSYYRMFEGNDTSKLKKSAANLKDRERLGKKFALLYPEFSPKIFRSFQSERAINQCIVFLKSGQMKALWMNLNFLIRHTPFPVICRFIFNAYKKGLIKVIKKIVIYKR